MPEPLWIYLMALLYCTNMTTCSAIADACDNVSHDRLTRMLQGTWSGHTLLNLALRTLFTVAGGYLIVDDTVVAVLRISPRSIRRGADTRIPVRRMGQRLPRSSKHALPRSSLP